MIEFGKTLKSARESKGYTLSQLAETTHLKSSVIEGLENEDFSMIAAPIYGRGFVKLYCEAVGIDPKPLVEEFMAILNGNREITIKERPVAEAAETQAEVQPPAAPPVQPPSAPEPDLFSQPAEPVTPPPIPPAAPSPEPATSFSRFAAPIRDDEPPSGLSFVNPRILILAGCAFALLIVMVFGVRALYRATTSAPTTAEPESAEITEPAAESTPVAKPAVRTRQQTIPPLYID